MNYMRAALLVVLCLSAVACTAAKQGEATTTASTEWRMKSLEESFLNFRETQRQQADEIDRLTRENEAKVKDLEERVAFLESGQAADVSDDMAEEAPVDKGWVTDLKPEDEGWVEGQKPETEKPVAQSTEEKPWAQVPGAPVVIPEPKKAPRTAPAKVVAAKPTKKKKSTKSSAQVIYDKALALYNGDKVEGARGAFDEFLKKYPKHALTPNAIYWKGETYYSQKNYAQAILTFREVPTRFPKHAKAAGSLLKIGMAYDKTGDRDNAIFYLRALVEDYPKSSPAKLARKELARLGG